MSDQIVKKETIDETSLAIGLQFSMQIPDSNRAFGFTSGFPIDWPIEKINALVDKITTVADRQLLKQQLAKLENTVREDYRQLAAQTKTQADYQEDIRRAWTTRGKHGDFTMSESQQTADANYSKNIKMLQDAIAANERLVQELRERCR